MQNCDRCGHACHCGISCQYIVNWDKGSCRKTYVYTDRLDAYDSKDYFFDRADFITEKQTAYEYKPVYNGYKPETTYKEATGTIGGKYVKMSVPNTVMVQDYTNSYVPSGCYVEQKKIAVYQYIKCYCKSCECVNAHKETTKLISEPDTCCILF